MPNKRVAWFSSPMIWFLAASGVMFPVALIARLDEWLGMGNEFSQVLLALGVAFGLMGLLYYSANRGKTKGLLIGWLCHLHFWTWAGLFLLLLYHARLYQIIVGSQAAGDALMEGRLRVVGSLFYVLLFIGSVAFIANITQARIKSRRSTR